MLFEKFLGSLKNKSKFDQDILMLKDGVYEIIPFKPTRTNLQNRYLWGGVYGTIAKEIGEDVHYVHGVMGLRFLLDESKKAPYVRSTTTLTTAEFSEYVEKIRNFVAQWLYIPSPEERKKANGLLEIKEEE